MARLMPALEFRSFHSHRSCENVPNTTRLATLPPAPAPRGLLIQDSESYFGSMKYVLYLQ
jgi:hypothetical protein